MSNIKLSILILTIPERKNFLDKLLDELHRQIMESGQHESIEILVNASDGDIGSKRNYLLNEAKGKYLNFFDDDDMPGNYYILTLLSGISMNVDVISLRGIYSVDGIMDGIFEHSIKYSEWKNDQPGDIKYLRNPNHLNCIRSTIAKQFQFPRTNFGEDHDWSKQIQKSGLLKKEYYHQEILYYYNYRSKK